MVCELFSDIREDVRALKDWVCEMERSLGSLQILTSWSRDKLSQKLTEHQVTCLPLRYTYECLLPMCQKNGKTGYYCFIQI